MGYEELQNKIKELEKQGIDVSFHKKVAEAINLMDRQLSEDKKLFGYLLDNASLTEAEDTKIRELIARHTEEFDK